MEGSTSLWKQSIWNKLAAALVIVCMFFNGCLGIAYAQDFSDAGTGICQVPYSSEQVYWAGSSDDIRYGDQILDLQELTIQEREDAKAVYDKLTTISMTTVSLTVQMPFGWNFTSATSQPTKQELASSVEYVKKISQVAVDAYLRDYPQVFWIDIEKSQWYFRYRYQSTDSGYTNRIISLEYKISNKTQYPAPTVYATRLNQAVTSFPVTGNNRYDRLKSIHDRLCSTVVYAEGNYAHEAYGALLDGKSVCEGYAKAFKLICDREGIPCVLVTGTSLNNQGQSEFHMWDYVQMENGKWYGVDVTWDDGADRIYYDFFLAGADTRSNRVSNKTFSQSHKEDGDFNQTDYAEYTYPTISSVAYLEDSKDPMPTATPEPKPPRPLPDGSYTYGDVDENGLIEAEDALLILKAVVRMERFDQKISIVADVDNDWQVGSGDALCVLKRVVGLIGQFPVETASNQ